MGRETAVRAERRAMPVLALLCCVTAQLAAVAAQADGGGGRIAALEAQIAALKAGRRGGLACAVDPEGSPVELTPLEGDGGYTINASSPLLVELALGSRETLIRLPNGKGLRIFEDDVDGPQVAPSAFDLPDIAGVDVWGLIGANGLSVLICLGMAVVASILEYQFGCLGMEGLKVMADDYHVFMSEMMKAVNIINGRVDESTAEEEASQNHWAKLALDIKAAKEVGSASGGNMADVVDALKVRRADDIERFREMAEERLAAIAEHGKHVAQELKDHAEEIQERGNELAGQAQALAADEDVRAGAADLRESGRTGLAAREAGGGSMAAMRAGADAVDMGKMEAAKNAVSPRASTTIRYRALAAGHIRAGVGMETDKVGQLVVGEEIVMLSSGTVGDGTVRIQFARGWVSLRGKSGKPVLELIE
jgi:hypothetical protein